MATQVQIDQMFSEKSIKRGRFRANLECHLNNKKANSDPSDDKVFEPLQDAPKWAQSLIAAMKKVTFRMDALATNFSSFATSVNSSIEEIRNETKAEIDSLKSKVNSIEMSHKE